MINKDIIKIYTGKRDMKKTALILSIMTAIVIAVIIAWKVSFPTYSFRYKITINVETPDGLKTGNAVREISIAPSLNLTPEMGATKKISGEAVIIDLGQKGILFGLLSSDSYNEVFEAFPIKGATTPEGLKFYESLKPGTKATITKNIPRFVRFSNLSEPKSVEKVDPHDMSASLGEGFRLKELTVEIVDEPILWQVKNYLPWIAEFRAKRLDGQRFGTVNTKYKTANSLSAGAFTAGENE